MPLVEEIEGGPSNMIEEDVSLMSNTKRSKAVVDNMANRDHSMITLPAADIDDDTIENTITLLRRYHLGDPDAAKTSQEAGADLLPALLDVYRGRAGIRYEYPLYLKSGESDSDAPLAESISAFFARSVDSFAAGPEGARMLRDNLPRLERFVDKALTGQSEPVDARPLLTTATEALQKEIDLDEASQDLLQQDLDRLLATVEPGSCFLGYGPHVAIHLLNLAVQNHTHLQRKLFVAEVNERVRGLNQLLSVEREKSKQANKPAEVQSKVGTASRYFDSKALSGALGHKTQGSVSMDSGRLARVERTLKLLEDYDSSGEFISVIAEKDSPWLSAGLAIDVVESSNPCGDAQRLYEDESNRLGQVFAAFRVAKLEIEGKYEPSVHDSWFENFDWEAFSAQELLLIPTVVVLVSAGHISGEGLPPLTRLLSSRKPVQVLGWVQAHTNPGDGENENPLQNIRTELAYLGLGQRQANVVQASASRHDQLLTGFCASLGNSRASLYLVSTETDTPNAALPGAWLMASSAIECRAHPFFQVIRGLESESEDELSIEGNTQAGSDWSVNAFSYQNEQGQTFETDLAFTFADYCLLHESLGDHFRMVPTGCDSEDLVSVSEYLDNSVEKPERAIPFIFAVDENGMLHRVVISRALIMACRDRQNYWRSLQAQCGIHNKYVNQARQEVREQEQANAAEAREQLVAEYEAELTRVRQEATSDVMGKLATVLVGLDPAALVSGSPPVAAPVAPSVTEPLEDSQEVAAETEVAEPEVVEEEEVSFNEPWIDSILCTTCDDCMSVSKLLFVYNEDKQAFIPDPSLGTYQELVKAAELCPARCIHPGKPLDPNEPGLEELIQRAEPFN
jgi:ferredoxin